MSDFRFSEPLASLPSVTPFVAPEALERMRGAPLKVRLGANESCFGIAPSALEAMARAAATSYYYGDPESYELRHALASERGVPYEGISVGSGIDDLLGLIARAFVTPGTKVVTSLGGYPTFNYHVEGFGGVLVRAPYRPDYHNDLDALAGLAKEHEPALVYLANPDNPTGTWYSPEVVREFHRSLPTGCVLVLDEAYVDFAPATTDFTPIAHERNVLRLRTFSKAHGLAGARIGYMLADPEVVAAFDKIRHHFGVNRVAQAGALASLRDANFLASVTAQVIEGRREYEALGAELGIGTVPSATNFVAFDMGSRERAEAILKALLELGVFIRKPGAPPIDQLIRVTVGNREDRLRFAEAFRKVVENL